MKILGAVYGERTLNKMATQPCGKLPPEAQPCLLRRSTAISFGGVKAAEKRRVVETPVCQDPSNAANHMTIFVSRALAK